MNLRVILDILKIVTTIGYLVATVLLFYQKRKPGFALAGIAWATNLGILVVSWLGLGEPPFGNMYYVLVFVAFSFVPLHLFMNKMEQQEEHSWLLPYFLAAATTFMIGSFFMKSQAVWRRSPALQSLWFVPHVTAYSISYALFTMAAALVVIALIRNKLGFKDKTKYEAASYRLIRLGFPLMTFGLLSGALWAEEAWGIYWSWDPKETWALITWILYSVYLHALRDKRLDRWANLWQILAFIALLITFIGVNLLPKFGSILHSYA